MLGGRIVKRGRYYNANGFAVAIVAVVTEGIDWAAYIGGTHDDRSADETVIWITRYGCKLSEGDARHYFNSEEFSLPYRH